MTDTFAGSQVPFLDMAANQVALSEKIAGQLKPAFTDLGLVLDSFVVENLSLPEELQKILDQRIGMNMVGDMGRYTQYQVAQSIPIAAANEGGGAAGVGAGLGAGMAMGQAMMDAIKKGSASSGTEGGAPACGRLPWLPAQTPSSASIAASRFPRSASSVPIAVRLSRNACTDERN